MELFVFQSRRIEEVHAGAGVGSRGEGHGERASRGRNTRARVVDTFDGALLGAAGSISADSAVPGTRGGFAVGVTSNLYFGVRKRKRDIKSVEQRRTL